MKKRTKEITPNTYAKLKGCNVSYIQRLLKKEKYHLLPCVIKVRKYSRFWTLEVPDNLCEDDFKEIKTNKIKK